MGALADAGPEATGYTADLACLDQGDPGDEPTAEATARGIDRAVVRLPGAPKGFILLPRR